MVDQQRATVHDTGTLMDATAWSSRAATALAGAAVLAAYVAVLSVMPKNVFWHPDEGGKYLTLRSIRPGTTPVLPYRGRRIDPQFQFYPGRCGFGAIYPAPQADGSVRFHWPIAFPLVSRWLFGWWGMTGLYLIPLLSGWLTALVAGAWAGAYDRRLAPWAVLLAGLATPILFYSVSFSEYTVATLLGAWAMAIACRAAPGARAAWVLAGALLFAAVLLRAEMLAGVISVGTVSVWSAWRARRTARVVGTPPVRRFLIAAAAVVLALAALFALLPERHRALIAGSLSWAAPAKLRYLLQGIVWILMGSPIDGPLTGGAWESIALIALGAAAAAALVRSQVAREWVFLCALALLCALSVLGLQTTPYLSRQGALVVAPYVIVGFLALPDAWRRRDERLVRLLAMFALYVACGFLAVFALRVTGRGEYLIGLDGTARYVLGLYPLGAALTPIAVAVVWRSGWHAPARRALVVLVTAMVVTAGIYEIRALQMVYARRQTLTTWQAALEDQGPVLTDIWWLAADLAPFFATHEMFCAPNAPAVSGWIEAAQRKGVRTFTLATLAPVQLERLGPRARELTLMGNEAVDGLHVYRLRMPAEGQLHSCS